MQKLTQNLIKRGDYSDYFHLLLSVLKRSVEPTSVNLKRQITVKRKNLNNILTVASKSVPFSV